MRKLPTLYFIIAVQSASILVIFLLKISLLYEGPVGRDFGLIAILAGVKRDSLAMLRIAIKVGVRES